MSSHVDDAHIELERFARFCSLLRVENHDPFELEPFQWRVLLDYFLGVLETLVLVSKKNGKTTLLAALGLYHLVTTDDAECVIGAASRDQATIIYDQATGFVRRSPELQERVDPKRGYREIRSKADAGRVRVLAADVDTADGVLPTLALVDELHRHKDAGLYGVFRDGLGPRDGQMVTISTAGDNEMGTLGQIRTAARSLPLIVRDGKYLYARSSDASFAMHEWSLDHDDDEHDLELVKQVNPASWQTVEKLRTRHDSPSMQPWQWLRFACGVWVAGDQWWMLPDVWRDGELDERLKPGERIAIGFDGSRYADATALVGCRIEDGFVQVLGMWEAPSSPPPTDWEVSSGEVGALLAEVMDEYAVVRGYFDPPLWQSEIDGWAREFGETPVMRFWTARARMMAAVERFRTDNVARSVPHAPDDRLDRHILNAQVKITRGGYWLTRRSEREKIDGAIATVLAYEARCDALLGDVDRTSHGFL